MSGALERLRAAVADSLERIPEGGAGTVQLIVERADLAEVVDPGTAHPGRWWRVVHRGDLVIETSVESEARETLAVDPDEYRLQRDWVIEATHHWRDEE